MYYSSQIFSSLPNLGPKIHGNFGILKPKRTREIRSVFRFSQGLKVPKSHPQTDLTRWIWAQACRFRDLATPNEGGEKSWWFFWGLRNIPFYLREIGKSKFFVEICWVYPRWIGREKRWNSPSVMVLFQKKHGLNPMVSSNLMVAITTVNPTNAAQHDTVTFYLQIVAI